MPFPALTSGLEGFGFNPLNGLSFCIMEVINDGKSSNFHMAI